MTSEKSDIVKKLESIELGKKSAVKLQVWRFRRYLRDSVGRDILDTSHSTKGRKLVKSLRFVYHQIDKLLSTHITQLVDTTPKKVALTQTKDILCEHGYVIVDEDLKKPWGGFFRLQNDNINHFLDDFFPDTTLQEAQLGHGDIELSPKILIVCPGQRLSWQLHHRRAEKWRFLTDGAYYQSDTDEMKTRHEVKVGVTIQFQQGERHRLCAMKDGYTVVAEIWQHTDSTKPSDEDDIVRLEDDYNRSGL